MINSESYFRQGILKIKRLNGKGRTSLRLLAVKKGKTNYAIVICVLLRYRCNVVVENCLNNVCVSLRRYVPRFKGFCPVYLH